MTDAEALGLPSGAFAKGDGTADLDFYAPARLVTHIDEEAIRALAAFYASQLYAGDRVLDLMSSWVSHLPDEVGYASVTGHGLNAAELAATTGQPKRALYARAVALQAAL